ncbi:MAG TPA: hypothetical protein VD741_06150 [Solirubrobacterales bacterium]|nr:hypothetical protein [Solirubrobacterales bacterium]
MVAVAASTGNSDGLAVVIPLITSAIALIGVLVTLIVNGYRANRERRRELFAGGWAAVQSYKEMAFAIRRRSSADPPGERVRLSEELREIQRDISFHEAMIGRDLSDDVASAYRELVRKTREVAGGIIKRSWDEPPIKSDSEMHAPEIAAELQALRAPEDAYLDEVAAAMTFGGRRKYAI